MPRDRFGITLLFVKDEGGGSGGDDSSERLTSAVQGVLDRHKGDAGRAVEALLTETRDLREERRELRQQIKDLTERVPGGESVVLSGEQAIAWAAYQALGKPDEIRARIDSGVQLQTQLDGLKRAETMRDVAETAGYKPAVLSQMDAIARASGKALTFAVREQTRDGKPVKTAYVKDGDKESPLADYAAENWADFLPALTATGGQGLPVGGVRFPNQHTGGTHGAPSLVDTFLNEQETARAKIKNPLTKT